MRPVQFIIPCLRGIILLQQMEAPMYKSMEFLYAGKKLKKGNISFLFFGDQFSNIIPIV